LRGGSFRRVLRTQALRRGACRARRPRWPAAAVPAVFAAAPASTTARATSPRQMRR